MKNWHECFHYFLPFPDVNEFGKFCLPKTSYFFVYIFYPYFYVFFTFDETLDGAAHAQLLTFFPLLKFESLVQRAHKLAQCDFFRGLADHGRKQRRNIL